MTQRKFFLYRKQAGEGCDYTIGCGERLTPLQAQTVGDAVGEAQKQLRDEEDDEGWGREDAPWKSALVVEQVGDLTGFCLEQQKLAEERERAEERAEKKAQLEKLKKELEG